MAAHLSACGDQEVSAADAEKVGESGRLLSGFEALGIFAIGISGYAIEEAHRQISACSRRFPCRVTDLRNRAQSRGLFASAIFSMPDRYRGVALRPNAEGWWWCWVFVGPAQRQLRELSRLPNVVLLGQQPHQELARYIKAFDVCIVPYLNNGETATIVPVKINEYLAGGKPVVSTRLPAVLDFNKQHQILTTAESHSETFLAAIEQALKAPNGDSVIARRREVAALHDWHQRLGEMSRLIELQQQTRGSAQD